MAMEYDKRRGIYFARIQVAGNRVYYNLGSNLKEASREFKRLLGRRGPGRWARNTGAVNAATSASPEATLRELAHLHLEWVQNNRSPGTYMVRHRYVNEFLRFCATRVQYVGELNSTILHEYVAWARGNSKASANAGIGHLRHVKSMLLWGERWDICPQPVKKFPAIQQSPPTTKRFTDVEFRKLLAVVPTDFRDFLVFGLLTGLRPQELRTLTRDNIAHDDLGRPFLRVEHHKTSRMARSAKPRTVPLNSTAAEILTRRLASTTDFVFKNARGHYYSGPALRRKLKRWCIRAQIAPKPPYALRHSFATQLAASRVNQTVLGHLMGHTTLQTTARYVANIDEHYRGAIESGELALRRLLDSEKPTQTPIEKTREIKQAS